MEYEEQIRYLDTALQLYLSSAVSNCRYIIDTKNEISNIDSDYAFSIQFYLDKKRREHIVFYKKI